VGGCKDERVELLERGVFEKRQAGRSCPSRKHRIADIGSARMIDDWIDKKACVG